MSSVAESELSERLIGEPYEALIRGQPQTLELLKQQVAALSDRMST